MKKKCPNCRLVNYPTASSCARCDSPLMGRSFARTLARRASICLAVCVVALAGFYVSLVFSADPLSYEQKKTLSAAIDIIEENGFSSEALLLRRLAVFRASDNWLNASVAKENAFAATNFPFEIVTLYSDFFAYPVDDVERAAILLHEAKHLQGADEKEAYEFVWRNREKLGWTSESYGSSMVWAEIRKQTRDYVPGLFVCDINPFGDCTEPRKPGF